MKIENYEEETRAIYYCNSCMALEEFDCCCEEEDEWEPDGYECLACGNIQSNKTGFGCDVCSSYCFEEWYH